jgi:anthranilate phosphoribosyltransferase
MLLLSQNGVRIFAHGARGHTAGRLYTEDVFEQLNLPVVKNTNQLNDHFKENKLCFMALNHFCSPLDHLIRLRDLFGLRSPVHTLCRLINPLNANATLQSVFHPSYANTHHQAAQLLGETNAMVVKGDSGEFEYRPQAKVNVNQLTSGTLKNYVLSKYSEHKPQLALTTELLLNIWRGDDNLSAEDLEYAERVITGTTALALMTINANDHFEQALDQSFRMWEERDRSLI